MITEEVWQELEKQHPAIPGLVRRRVREDSDRNLFLAVAHPSLQRALILGVAPDSAGDLPELPSTRALHTVVDSGPSGLVEVRVLLTAPEMARVFTPFADDVIEAVAGTKDDRGALQAM